MSEREPPEVEEALLGQLQRAADGGYDVSRMKGLCDRAAVLIALYRDIFAEITAKAVHRSGTDPADPERVTSYVIPTGPIHRAAGKLGFQMFDGERYLAEALADRDALAARLAKAIWVIEVASAKFTFYERSHLAKGTLDGDAKAKVNAELADLCRSFLTPTGEGK